MAVRYFAARYFKARFFQNGWLGGSGGGVVTAAWDWLVTARRRHGR